MILSLLTAGLVGFTFGLILATVFHVRWRRRMDFVLERKWKYTNNLEAEVRQLQLERTSQPAQLN
jgi:hypothetical protein